MDSWSFYELLHSNSFNSSSYLSNYKKLKEVSLREMAVNGPGKEHNFNTVAPGILKLTFQLLVLPLYLVCTF